MRNLILAVSVVLGIFCTFEGYHTHRQTRRNRFFARIAILLILVPIILLGYASAREVEIQKRGRNFTFGEENVYELVALTYDNQLSEKNKPSYVEVSGKRIFHFYYKVIKNEMECIESRTIESDDVLIIQTNKCKPMVIETIRIYEYELTDFERSWFYESEIAEKFPPEIQKSYEIYVPVGTIVENYNLN